MDNSFFFWPVACTRASFIPLSIRIFQLCSVKSFQATTAPIPTAKASSLRRPWTWTDARDYPFPLLHKYTSASDAPHNLPSGCGCSPLAIVVAVRDCTGCQVCPLRFLCLSCCWIDFVVDLVNHTLNLCNLHAARKLSFGAGNRALKGQDEERHQLCWAPCTRSCSHR